MKDAQGIKIFRITSDELKICYIDTLPIYSWASLLLSLSADLERYEIRYAVAVQNDDKKRIKYMRKISCDCLPGCTSINYDVETSQADFQWLELARAMKHHTFDNTT